MKKIKQALIITLCLSLLFLIGLIVCFIGMSSSPVDPNTGVTNASSAWSIVLAILIPLFAIFLVAAIVLLFLYSSAKKKEIAQLPESNSTIKLVASSPINNSQVLYKIVDNNPNTEKTFRSLIFFAYQVTIVGIFILSGLSLLVAIIFLIAYPSLLGGELSIYASALFLLCFNVYYLVYLPKKYMRLTGGDSNGEAEL